MRPFLKSETEIQENTGEAQCVSGHNSCDTLCDSLPKQMSNGCMTAYFKSAFLVRESYMEGPRLEHLSSTSIIRNFAQFSQP